MLVLLGLGSWQLQRLQWKLGLIQRIAARVHAPPVPLEDLLAAHTDGAVDVEYTHVTATGQFHHDLERYLYASGQNDWGWDVFTPLAMPGGQTVLVNRGYVPRQQLDRSLRQPGLPSGAVVVTALVRLAPGPPPWWAPRSDLRKQEWYWPEIADMAASLRPPPARPVTWLYLDADATSGAAPPAGGVTNLELSNRHLEYAVTWFGFAVTLAIIYAIFVFRRLHGARG